MKQICEILESIHRNGFNGVFPFYIERMGEWDEEYALFVLEFEQNNDELALDLCQFIEDNIEGCEVFLTDQTFEVMGNCADEEEYWEFPLIDEIW